MTSSHRILTIQSHVVLGYVAIEEFTVPHRPTGNKSATFPLQLLGWDVDALNTVQFSNHLGYGHHGGDKMSVEHLQSCINALDKNGLLTHDALLTGFTPGPQGVETLQEFALKLRANNPQAVYLVDPVMGDSGKLYVDSEVPAHYKCLLRTATIATPNDFEAELLTGIRPGNIASLLDCLRAFHTQYGLPHIVITSVALPASTVSHLSDKIISPDPEGDVLVCAGSTRLDGDTPDITWVIVFPRVAQQFVGVGDLFASVLLGHFLNLSGPQRLSRATELALATVQGIISATYSDAEAELHKLAKSTLDAQQLRLQTARALELKIVQNRQCIDVPDVKWKACAI
ncbi:Ribokinase-like protein [Melampsora americana]|nr:Ribokinase-like protein [Melampsora americana]